MTLTREQPVDLTKVLGEWALAAGRYLQSEQTGYVHYYYKETAQAIPQTIPLVENIYFVFALLRSRLVEYVQEAKGLLKRLLIFQNQSNEESCGNFPVYLHDYPLCQDPTLGLQLLAPFYWILKQFGHVLGNDLKQQLEQAAKETLRYSLQAHAVKVFPYSFAVRLAAAQIAYGQLLDQRAWEEEGQKLLDQLAESQLEGWYSTHHLSDLLVALQMVYSRLSTSPWHKLWHLLEHTWHVQTGCYIGPCIREWQAGEEPKPNLYDLYAGYFAKQFSRRAALLNPYHLQAVLIQPSEEQFAVDSSSFIVEGHLKQQAWQIIRQPTWAYTLLEKNSNSNPSMDKTYTPFRLIWGDLHMVHSLVCQGGHYERVRWLRENQTIKLFFDLSAEAPLEDREKRREVEFFVDFHADLSFHLDNQPATTFELGQVLSINFGKHQLLVTCDLLQGEGDFLGHLMRSNRPSQVHHKGESSLYTYDWTFFLRTIRRQGSCCLQVTLAFQHLAVRDT